MRITEPTKRAAVAALAAVLGGCAEPTAVESTAGNTAPAPARVEPPKEVTADVPGDLDALLAVDSDRWLHVEGLREGAEGGWATGDFVKASNKIVIDTEGVARFAVDLDRIDIDWTRRVVLRIDGSNSELTRKHFPTLRLQRSRPGSWTPVKKAPVESNRS